MILSLKIPAVSLTSPTTWLKSRSDVSAMVKGIITDYGKEIKSISSMTKVSPEIIASFIAIESGGKKNVNDAHGGATRGFATPYVGLCQFNRAFCFEVIEREKKEGRLSPAELTLLNKYGITFDSKGQITGTGVERNSNNTIRAIKKDVAIKPELNILIGTLYIGQYIDSTWGTEKDGTIRMDRVITYYNWGKGGFDKNNLNIANLERIMSIVPDETTGYIKKMIGKNGALDVATSDLKTLFA